MHELAHFDFDRVVGHVAAAVFGGIHSKFPYPALMLLPGITMMVRRILEPSWLVRVASGRFPEKAAQEIRAGLVPLLYSLNIDEFIIEHIAPDIEEAADRALREPDQETL